MAGSGTNHLRREALLRVTDLHVEFPGPGKSVVHAVSGVSFDLQVGETLGIVGESGCGKSTTGRAVMQLEEVTSGSVAIDGEYLTQASGELLRRLRRPIQMIFQDPVSSLNPSRRVREIVREGLQIWGAKPGDHDDRVRAVMESVGLGGDDVGQRRPHEFSGGQCQRICIARALVMEPDVMILDEPVSALDVSVQAQILNLLEQLKTTFGLTMVFISHDLAVVKNISDRVMVMYLGKVCEVAESDLLYADPAHPYSRALLASIPGHTLDLPPADELISGELPSPISPPSGCRFRTRCPSATAVCAAEEPVVRRLAEGHYVACHYPVGHEDLHMRPSDG